MLSALVSRIVILLGGVLYPAYSSFKAVKSKDHKAYTTWMMYWIVFAVFLTLETFTDIFLSWFPFYYEIKIVLVLWLSSPYTEGAKNIYRRLIHQRLLDNEGAIDGLLSNTGQVGINVMRRLSTGVMSYASTGIMNAARRASGQEPLQTDYGEVEQPIVERETLLQHRVVMADSSGHYQPSPSDPSEPFVEVVHSDIGQQEQVDQTGSYKKIY